MTQVAPQSNTFPLVPAAACACCRQPLATGQGYDVPYIGAVGPKCVHKYTALALALAQADGLTVRREDAASTLGAVERLRRSLLVLGYVAQLVDNADGSKSLKIGERTRKHPAVCQTWEERRAAFERDLILASAAQEEAAPVDVLAAPERHQQIEQRHYAAAVAEASEEPLGEDRFAVRARYAAWVLAQNDGNAPICGDCEKEIVPDEATEGWDGRFYCGACWDATCDMASGELTSDGPTAQPEQRHMARAMCGDVRSRVVTEFHEQPQQQQMTLFSKAPGPDTRFFKLEYASTVYGALPGRTDLYAESWVELQRELRMYCQASVVSALDLAWVRPTPITKDEWTITETTGAQDGPYAQPQQQQMQVEYRPLRDQLTDAESRAQLHLDELGGICDVLGLDIDESHRAAGQIAELRGENASLVEALTPSMETKQAYMGEFHFETTVLDEDDEEVQVRHTVPWTTTKEIMAMILARAQADRTGPSAQLEQRHMGKLITTQEDLFRHKAVEIIRNIRGPEAAAELEATYRQEPQRRLPSASRAHLPLPERLHRLALMAKGHEVRAEAGSVARLMRGERADRLAGLAWAARQGKRPEQVEEQAAYPEVAYGQLAEGLRKLAAGPTAQPEQQQAQRADGVTDVSLRVLDEIKVECARQQAQEGWSPEHDDQHDRGELAEAAGVHALIASGSLESIVIRLWPWSQELQSATPRQNLLKAGALIVAEIERLDRLAQDGPHAQPEQQQQMAVVQTRTSESGCCPACGWGMRADDVLLHATGEFSDGLMSLSCPNCRESLTVRIVLEHDEVVS